MNTTKYNGKEYDSSNESLFSCGMASSYYGSYRPPYKKAGLFSEKIYDLTPEEVEAYEAGYKYNETVLQDFKRWD